MATIPVGVAGSTVRFDDATLALRYDPETATILIGEVAVCDTPVAVAGSFDQRPIDDIDLVTPMDVMMAPATIDTFMI